MDLNDLRIFMDLVECGSIQRAAAARRVSRNVVRRALTHLEEEIGVPLLLREARGVVLTPAGEQTVEHATGLLAEAGALMERARGASAQARGALRVVVPTGIPTAPRARALIALGAQHTDLDVEVIEVEDPLSRIGDRFDLMFHFDDAPRVDGWFSHLLMRVPVVLQATSTYLERHGAPSSVNALGGHRLLQWRRPGDVNGRLPLKRGGDVEVHPWVQTANLTLLNDLASADAGILFAPILPAVLGFSEDRVQLLTRTVGQTMAFRALSPQSSRLDPRIRALLKNGRRLLMDLQ